MAIGKEAPIPACCVAAAATREALAATVAELTETLASLPATTIKRRLRDAEIVLPFENGSALTNGFAAAADGVSPYAKIQGIIPSKPIEGLEKK
jgi:hypothetical protein